jgi:hypothetical protein
VKLGQVNREQEGETHDGRPSNGGRMVDQTWRIYLARRFSLRLGTQQAGDDNQTHPDGYADSPADKN